MADEKPREELTEEELIDQFRKMKVSDLVLSTLFTLTQLGYGKLEPSARDLDQARLAIDSLGALLPVAKTAVPEEVVRDFESALANLRLAYAKAAAESPGAAEPAASEPQPESAEAPPES
jgi:hypothetical protein